MLFTLKLRHDNSRKIYISVSSSLVRIFSSSSAASCLVRKLRVVPEFF